jgi:hypothetical protein
VKDALRKLLDEFAVMKAAKDLLEEQNAQQAAKLKELQNQLVAALKALAAAKAQIVEKVRACGVLQKPDVLLWPVFLARSLPPSLTHSLTHSPNLPFPPPSPCTALSGCLFRSPQCFTYRPLHCCVWLRVRRACRRRRRTRAARRTS